MAPLQTGSGARRARRLRRSRDFRAVMRSGRRARHPLLQVVAKDNGLPHNRFGFSVGRRVGKATTRNRVKRRLREIMRELPLHHGYDIVTVAREPASAASYHDLKEAAAQCLRRIDLLCTEAE